MATGIGHTSRKCHSKPEPVPCCSPSKECHSCAVATQRISLALLCGWNFSLQNGSLRPPVAIEADEINENSEVDPVAALATFQLLYRRGSPGATTQEHFSSAEDTVGHAGQRPGQSFLQPSLHGRPLQETDRLRYVKSERSATCPASLHLPCLSTAFCHQVKRVPFFLICAARLQATRAAGAGWLLHRSAQGSPLVEFALDWFILMGNG